MKYIEPFPQEFNHLASEFEAESKAGNRTVVIVGYSVASLIYAIFSLADTRFYPETAQFLLVARWLAILVWVSTIGYLYRQKELKSNYYVPIFLSVAASALLTEAILIISGEPTGPYMVAVPIFILVGGMVPSPLKWAVANNLTWLALFIAAPIGFGLVFDWPRFLFYCAMVASAAIASTVMNIQLTRLRWESFLNRHRAEETSEENARLYRMVKRFNEELEGMVRERTHELSEAYAKLELLDKNKLDFIKVVSHELRTPMTIFSGYSQMLIGNPTIKADNMLSVAVQSIRDGSIWLKEIVNMMLDVVKIDSKTLEVILESVSMAAVLEKVHAAFADAIKERNLTLTLTGLDSLPKIEADSELLYKVFYNIVVNAIKYTPDGGSVVVNGETFEGQGTAANQGVKITVSDTGIGIDPEYHEVIFDKFYQTGKVELHSSGKTKFKGGGPGLGLAIARGIVLAHGGKIWVESPGNDESACPGSRFIVTLPVVQVKAIPIENA